MRETRSYKWAADRVDNVLGMAFMMKAKGKEGDENGDAPEESIMLSGKKPNPHMMQEWMR